MFNPNKDPLVAVALLIALLEWLVVVATLTALTFRWIPFDAQTFALACFQLAIAVGAVQYATKHGYTK